MKADEMIEAERVEALQRRLEAGQPPGIPGLAEHGPVVQRVAPTLAIGAEVVRGNTRHHALLPFTVQLENRLVSPNVRAVVGHEHGHVPQQLHAA